MEISFLGHASFRIKGRGAAVVTDPFDASIGFRFPRVTADIILVSHDHDDHSKDELVAPAASGTKKIIKSPGEYEVKGISVLGFRTYHDAKKGAERGENTIYLIEVDDFRILHLGDLGHKLSDKLVAKIGEVDILMIPTGGVYTIGPKEAAEITSQISPNIILPMHFGDKDLNQETFGKLSPVEDFISATGFKIEKQTKLSIKKSATAEDEQVIIQLTRK